MGSHVTNPRQLPVRRRSRHWARNILLAIAGVLAAFILIGLIGAALGVGQPKAAPHPAPATSSVSPSPTAASVAVAPKATHKAVHKVRRRHRVVRPAPAPVTSSPQPAAGPTGCYPISDEGTCYEPGEYCRDSDHGVTGVAGDGETITCEDNDGWRWEPS
jgi:hypothetical protein